MLRPLLVFVGIPFGIALVIFGGVSAVNASQMQSQGKLVEATITQSQMDENKAPEIKYSFQLAGDARTYTHGDESGGRNLWVNVPEKPAGTTTQVRYLPSNPWVNSPVDATANPLENALSAAGGGLLVAIVGIALAISDVRKWRKSKALAATPNTTA